jgi:hypothetical protein
MYGIFKRCGISRFSTDPLTSGAIKQRTAGQVRFEAEKVCAPQILCTMLWVECRQRTVSGQAIREQMEFVLLMITRTNTERLRGIQRKLNLEPDGAMGPDTLTAIEVALGIVHTTLAPLLPASAIELLKNVCGRKGKSKTS